MNLTIAGISARALLGRRRVLLLLPMPILVIGLTLLASTSRLPVDVWAPILLTKLGLAVVLPLTALIVGSSVLGLEIEDGTITHLLAKPLPRSQIIISKLVVAWGVTTLTAALPLAIAGAIAKGPELAVGLLVGAAVSGLAYSAFFLALSLATRRPVAVGLVYILLWENLLGGLVKGTHALSVQQYGTAIADRIGGGTGLLQGSLGVGTAAVMAAVFIVAGAVIATVRLRSFSLTAETS